MTDSVDVLFQADLQLIDELHEVVHRYEHIEHRSEIIERTGAVNQKILARLVRHEDVLFPRLEALDETRGLFPRLYDENREIAEIIERLPMMHVDEADFLQLLAHESKILDKRRADLTGAIIPAVGKHMSDADRVELERTLVAEPVGETAADGV